MDTMLNRCGIRMASSERGEWSPGKKRVVGVASSVGTVNSNLCGVILLLTVVGFLGAGLRQARAADQREPELSITLKDGTSVRGTLGTAKLSFVTRYGVVDVAGNDIGSYADGLLTLSDGSTLKGSFKEDTVVKVMTSRGELSAAIKDVLTIGSAAAPQPTQPAQAAPAKMAVGSVIEPKDGRGVLTGTVRDIFGRPLTEVEVHIQGTQFRATTGADGSYACEYVPGKIKASYEKTAYFGVERQWELAAAAKFPAELVMLTPEPPKAGFYGTASGRYEPVAAMEPKTQQTQAARGWDQMNPLMKAADVFLSVAGEPAVVLAEGTAIFVNSGEVQLRLYRVDDKGVFFRTEVSGGPAGEQSGFAQAIECKSVVVADKCALYIADLKVGDYVFAGGQQQGHFVISRAPITGPYYYIRVKNKNEANIKVEQNGEPPAAKSPAGPLAAEQGSAEAQYKLGLCYNKGQGVKKDYAEAVKWYRKSADQGNAAAQCNLGRCYYAGQGVAQDYAEAVKWFRKAAEQGLAAAQYCLGVCYYKGQGVTQDYAEAVKWYRKAAEQGDRLAQGNLGLCYYEGQGVAQDYAEALKWYRKAVEQGNAAAQCNLGRCYYSGRGVAQDCTEAVKWYRKAADQGDALAQYCLGVCYYKGQGVTQDYAEAVKWFRNGAEQENALAQSKLGLCYAHGLGVTQDYAEAVKWYRKAADQGNAYGQYCLGFCYYKGQGMKQDYTEAVKLYRKAAEQGEALAECDLGECYDNGQGVAQDHGEAMKWYRKAAEHGDSNAKAKLQELDKSAKPTQNSESPAPAAPTGPLAVTLDGPQEAMLGENVKYTARVTNTGTSKITGVQVRDDLPTGMTSLGGQATLVGDVGDLAPGQSKDVVLATRIAARGTYSNSVSAKADGGLTANSQRLSTDVR